MSSPGVSQALGARLGLRQMILDGQLGAGDRVSEVKLAAALAVSRTPLRLALAALEHEGLLEPVAGGGFRVRSFTRRQVTDAIDLRGVLEGSAARLAAERVRDRRELSGLVGCVAEMDRFVRPARMSVEDFAHYVELNERFHRTLIELAGSDALAGAYAQVLALPFASPSAFVMLQAELPESRQTLFLAQLHHVSLLEAIESGEGARAEALAREHARLARANLEIALETDRALAQLPGGRLIELTEAVGHGG